MTPARDQAVSKVGTDKDGDLVEVSTSSTREFVECPSPPVLAVAALVAQGVELVVVGGCALVLARLATHCGDLDIVPSRTRANLERLVEALSVLGVRGLHLTALSWQPIVGVDSPFGRIDVLLQRSEREYDALRAEGFTSVVLDIPVRVAPVARVVELRRLHRAGLLYE
jgi:hypothetical protein